MLEQTLSAPENLLKDFVTVQVRHIQREATNVVSVLLEPTDGGKLPGWNPGAHIDVMLPGDLLRQYSLTSDPGDAKAWRIAVLLETEGRGGSKYIHTKLRVGDAISVRGPRNQFPRGESSGPTQFIAGGIGITPLLPMIHQCQQQGQAWNLLYLGSNRAAMPFLSELEGYGDRVRVYPKDEEGPLDLSDFLREKQLSFTTTTYACGPQRMLSELEQFFLNGSHGSYYSEIFNPDRMPLAVTEHDTSFTVEISDGSEVEVAADETIIDALERKGIRTLSSCRKGTCGTCETEVIAGEPDHRDTVLSAEEREANETMMICVSRCVGDRIALNL